jgi:hypothetical protein
MMHSTTVNLHNLSYRCFPSISCQYYAADGGSSSHSVAAHIPRVTVTALSEPNAPPLLRNAGDGLAGRDSLGLHSGLVSFVYYSYARRDPWLKRSKVVKPGDRLDRGVRRNGPEGRVRLPGMPQKPGGVVAKDDGQGVVVDRGEREDLDYPFARVGERLPMVGQRVEEGKRGAL